MRVWTEQQQIAISSPARRIICSAAAGSGKTAVMVERVIRMLQDGADPESFLVVTFTNAAASEMKQKIRDRLREMRHRKELRAAWEKIDFIEISTIHSFCQHLIRQEFQAAGVDSFFALCDPSRAGKLFSLAFHSACTYFQKEQDPDYLYWKKCFSAKETEEIVRSVYNFMMSLPDPDAWLDRSCDEIPLKIEPSHPWFETASEIVREKISRAQVILRRQYEMFSEKEHGEPMRATWKADSELFHVKQLWAEGKETDEEKLKAGFVRLASWTRLNSLEQNWKERYSDYREQLKKIMAEIDPLIRPDEEMVSREFGNMRASLQGLKKITRQTMLFYKEKKSALRVLDFNDLEHYALHILKTEPAGSAVRKRYREIFVDECQDVSGVQDELIQQLASDEGHLFMVGDVKQSIYRFRLANPKIFLDRIDQYEKSPSKDEEHLTLQTNFRSRPEILETVNTVFRDIMKKETAEIEYGTKEELCPGIPAEGSFPVYTDIIRPNPDKTILESSADYLAARVKELKKENYSYKDMVILMPKVSGIGQKLADLLEERGIPVFFDGGGDFLEREEVGSFLALLKCIDNPFLDGPLLTVLKNAPFFFSEEELAQVRLRDPGKEVPFRDAFRACLEEEGELGVRCREAAGKLREWRRLASVMQMSTFIRYVCSDSHLYAMAGVSAAGKTARRNLQVLCLRAEEAEKSGVYSLRRFLSYVTEQAGGDQSSATPLAEEDDVMRIMTMHKSKGLQFPVVFCMGLEGNMSRRNEGGVMLDEKLGICLKYKRPEYRISRQTPAALIFSWKKEQEERAEKIRLLYVAMTRAQQRMYLAGVAEEDSLWQMPPGTHRVLSAADYMDWILPPLMDASKESTGCTQASNHWKIRVFDNNQQGNVENRPVYPQLEEWLDSLVSAPPVDEMWKGEKTENYISRMQKRSVTSLLRQADRIAGVDEADTEETPEEKRIPLRFSEALQRNDPGQLPAFMAPPPEKQGAWRGTVIHRFLSIADLDKLREAGGNLLPVLQHMKEEMLTAGVFTEEEGAVIRPEDAAAWFGSPLGRRLLASPQLRREWGFNYFLPDRNLLVQGVIDCAFREGDGWILVDYKTDRVEDTDAFVALYRPQLKWYAEALRELSGLPVKEAWLYSLFRSEAFRTEL